MVRWLAASDIHRIVKKKKSCSQFSSSYLQVNLLISLYLIRYSSVSKGIDCTRSYTEGDLLFKLISPTSMAQTAFLQRIVVAL